ncbi:hypothetical protein C0991_012153, partial [Blastosporella zonata]
TIGPQSRLVLYQRVFQGPGITVQEETLRATPTPLTGTQLVEDVPITLVLSPKQFIQDITVVYGDHPSDAPSDRVREWFGGSDDINYGYGGQYVWIVPKYTTQVSQALTSFDLVIQSNADARYNDVSKGAGGDYRYLIPVKQSNKDFFISDITLARSDKDLSSSVGNLTWHDLPQAHTQDINKGRGGSYLYLVWELQRVYEVKA